MTIEEFKEKILKPIYVEAMSKELISKHSAEENFVSFATQRFDQMVDFLVHRCFMHNIEIKEVEELRTYISHSHVLGSDSFFQDEDIL